MLEIKYQFATFFFVEVSSGAMTNILY